MKNKKIILVLLIIASLSITMLFAWKISSTIGEDKLLAKLNLSAKTSPQEIFLPYPLPILMYHHIQNYSKNDDTNLYVTPQNFEAQMEWLFNNGFQTVGFDYLKNPIRLTKKPVILTFDDGYQDAYNQVFPILKKYNFQATFYLIANDLGRTGNLTVPEITEMKDAGMNFGSHTLSHPDLTSISKKKAQQEIYESKKTLEQELGMNIKDFCYPGGTMNREIENIVINSGYTTATTTINETNIGKMDPFKLNRLNIRNETDFNTLPALKNL